MAWNLEQAAISKSEKADKDDFLVSEKDGFRHWLHFEANMQVRQPLQWLTRYEHFSYKKNIDISVKLF